MNKDRLVTTYLGQKVSRILCRNIKNKFYLVGDPKIKDSGECYLVEGIYHRFNNKKIEYDHEKCNYVLKHKNHLKYGIIDVKNDKFIFGYFSPNLTKNIKLINENENSDIIHCISEEVAKKLKFREHIGSGIFLPRENHNYNFFRKIEVSKVNKSNLPYDSRFASSITSKQYDKFFKPNYTNENLNILGDFLEKNNITFGIEFETTIGYIPDRICYKYGLISLRDGSIKGLEYVTIPYSGRKGLYALKEVCHELKKRSKFDITCALHIHLGGLDRSIEKILSSYILGYLVQDNMFNLQPIYKKEGSSIKSKNYCKPLDLSIFKSLNHKINNSNLLNNFKKIFKFVSDGVPFDMYDNNLLNVESHPSDPEGVRKWQIKSRYRWLNFVPIIFGNKKTLEFRHHTATFNFVKIINFLYNCASIIKIANDNSNLILNESSTLYQDLKKNPNNALIILSDFLVLNHDEKLKEINLQNKIYISTRTKIMELLKKNEDYIGKNENKYDKLYSENLNKEFWD